MMLLNIFFYFLTIFQKKMEFNQRFFQVKRKILTGKSRLFVSKK